jgi:hypothetical protein
LYRVSASDRVEMLSRSSAKGSTRVRGWVIAESERWEGSKRRLSAHRLRRSYTAAYVQGVAGATSYVSISAPTSAEGKKGRGLDIPNPTQRSQNE